MQFSRPCSCANWRIASRKGWPSISPTVPADLYEYHISLRIQSNAPLDLIGDVWNHLDGLPAVNSFTLIADNLKKTRPEVRLLFCDRLSSIKRS